jgi:hypothetical protein
MNVGAMNPTNEPDSMAANVIELVTCPCCGDASPVDEPIRALVHVLNAHGMRTRSSCCGHRGRSREREAYVMFWIVTDAVPTFCSALRRINIDQLDFKVEVGWNTWDPPPDGAAVVALHFSITDARGRAPKPGDLAILAEQIERSFQSDTNANAGALAA